MKILLIRPPGTGFYSYGFPLGVGYIAAILKKSGYNVIIYDALNDSPAFIREKISRENPDVIGISNQFSPQFDDVKSIARIAKDINKNFLVVAGGSHPSSCPSDFFNKTNCVDIVVIGEGEYTMLEIVQKISNNQPWQDIKGIAFKRNTEVIKNPIRPSIKNLDELPYPAYELFDMEVYFKLTNFSLDRPTFAYPGSERAINLITSRGCPYNCVFCSIHSVMGNIWRAHSPEYVINHIKFLIEKYKIKHIHFEDDNLTLDKDRFKRMLDLILEADLKISWDTPNGVRADILDEELLRKSKKAGCVYLVMGVESGDQAVLDKIVQKKLSLKAVETTSKLAKNVKLNLEAFFVIGFPGETIQNMRDTLNFAFKLQFRYGVYPILLIATPLPGTRLYEICVKKGYIKEDFSYSRISPSILSEGMIETEDFTLFDVRRLFKYFKYIRAMLAIINFVRFCFLSPIFMFRKFIYLFRIFFISSEKTGFNLKIFLRNLIRYNLVSP